MTKHFINEQYDVEEPDASRSYSTGTRREDYADSWKSTGNIIFVGLAGSGKTALSGLLSERTGLNVQVPTNPEDAVEALGANGQIVVLDDGLVENEGVRAGIHAAGKVFYLMAESRTLSSRLAERQGIADPEQLWRDMSARLAVMEPVFYSVLHFILQAGQSPESLLDDALEKIAF
jgi:shikimate kinase